jgi:SAM-dependent methyltransferase
MEKGLFLCEGALWLNFPVTGYAMSCCVSNRVELRVNMNEWWQDLFDEKYIRLFAETRPPLRTAQEVDGLAALFDRHGVPVGGEVLDLACGYGRITLPLARLGYHMTGFDLSPHLLARARQAATEAGLAVAWCEGDMRQLPEQWSKRFHAVVNIYSAFGYFDEPEENERVLAAVAEVLQPGGILILDLSHRDSVIHRFQPTDWFEVDDLLVCTSRQFDAISGINTEVWLWTDEHGERQSLYFKVHVYTATDLTRMVRQAGLEPVAYHGQLASPPGNFPFDPFTSRLVLVAQKPVRG